MNRESIFQKLQEKIPELEPYVFVRAKSTSSMYVKFKDDRLRSLRIGDHDGKEKYRYKWNLRKDIKKGYEQTDRGVHRFYYSWSEIDKFCKRIRQYWATIQRNEKEAG